MSLCSSLMQEKGLYNIETHFLSFITLVVVQSYFLPTLLLGFFNFFIFAEYLQW